MIKLTGEDQEEPTLEVGTVLGKVVLHLMKSVSEDTFFQTCEEIAPLWKELLEQEGIEEQINTIIRYLVETVKESPEKIRDSITQATNPEIGEKVMTAAEQLRSEGRIEGESKLLMILLKQRFGTIPEWAQKKLKGAQPQNLETWGLRVLDAPSLEEVLQ